MTDPIAPAASMSAPWRDLLEGLSLLARHGENDPLHCEHDVLTICADPAKFTDEELDRLELLGFHANVGEECFRSFRFGSA